MNLVSFPSYTCGALFCDFLNKESSRTGPNNNIASGNHVLGKMSLKNDYNGRGFDQNFFSLQVKSLIPDNKFSDIWIGTHCWVGELDTSEFTNVISITTENKNSKIYRFARIFYTMIAGKYPLTKPKKPDNIKLYNQSYDKVERSNVVNIEFEDVVEWKKEVNEIIINFVGAEFQNHINNRRKAWMEINEFLYDDVKMNYIRTEWDKENS